MWIVYAQELERMFSDGGTTAKKLILERMMDPSMRAFLSMELTMAVARKTPSSTPANDGGHNEEKKWSESEKSSTITTTKDYQQYK